MQDSSNQPLHVDAAFVRQHGPWMLKLARSVLMDALLAEDAVQEALLSVHKNRADFAGRSGVRTWLYRITVNAALALQRKRSPGECDIEEMLPLFDANACRIEEPWPQLITTEEVLERTELSNFVRQSIATLPEDYRICLQLRDVEELTVKEVADVLQISEENVKVRTHRARSALKRLLEPVLRGEAAVPAGCEPGAVTVTDITAMPLPETLRPSMARTVKGMMMAYMPMMITCQQFEEFIVDYLEESLPAGKRRLFDFHIRTCRECREYLAAYQQARSVARASTRLIGDFEAVPEDLLKAVVQSLGEEQ